MENKTVDARGMACPMPVVKTKKVLDAIQDGAVTTIVDNDAARQNILALAKSLGCETSVEKIGAEYHIIISKKGADLCGASQNISDAVLFISSSELGRGTSELGTTLMKSFLFTLVESEEVPHTLLFVNSGVYLTCTNSPVLEHLMSLQERGVEVLSCGTCLDYYGIKDGLCIGQVTNMYTIYEKMNKAEKVISL